MNLCWTRTRNSLVIKSDYPTKPSADGFFIVLNNMDHTSSGHMVGGSRVSNLKTLFPATMNLKQVENAVRQAYRFGKRVETQGDRVRIRGNDK